MNRQLSQSHVEFVRASATASSAFFAAMLTEVLFPEPRESVPDITLNMPEIRNHFPELFAYLVYKAHYAPIERGTNVVILVWTPTAPTGLTTVF